jgi:hypothetical protein
VLTNLKKVTEILSLEEKEFYILSNNHHPPGGCIDQAVASPLVRLMDFKLRIYW